LNVELFRKGFERSYLPLQQSFPRSHTDPTATAASVDAI